MAKKRDRKKKEKPKLPETKTFDDAIDICPGFNNVIFKKSWDCLELSNQFTIKRTNKEWVANMEKNVKNLWKKCGGLATDCTGLASEKAVIGVGAGQSFNKNKDFLKQIVNEDGVKDWPDRNFVVIASNHQYKPLLEMGIIPDFVMEVDSSGVVIDQLTTDIPDNGQNTILIAGLHCDPTVLNTWVDQGRELRFYMPRTKLQTDTFKSLTGESPKKHALSGGGNVLNSAWMISGQVFHSRIFMCVGNDLSFVVKDDVDKQRATYYSDRDYTTNAKGTGTGRDEAADGKLWAGFTLNKNCLYGLDGQDKYNIELDLVGTSITLWNYKTWAETTAIHQASYKNTSFHYFNCSEAGILGVMARDDSVEALGDTNNWFMLDQVCFAWHTTTLEDGITKFLAAKELSKCKKAILPDARVAEALAVHH